MKQFVLPFETVVADNESLDCQLSGRDFHYLIRVRRYTEKDRIPALCRNGNKYEMEFIRISRENCSVRLHPLSRQETGAEETGPKIYLMPALTKGKKMDLTVRQAVEGGASVIWPVLTTYSQIRIREKSDSEAKKRRWERIATEALQQCGGAVPVEVEDPALLPELLEKWNDRGPLFFLHERDIGNEMSGSLHRHLAVAVGELAIMVGPEGGLSSAETRLLLEKGAHPVYLGKRILRAETAAIYGLAAVRTIIRERLEWQLV